MSIIPNIFARSINGKSERLLGEVHRSSDDSPDFNAEIIKNYGEFFKENTIVTANSEPIKPDLTINQSETKLLRVLHLDGEEFFRRGFRDVISVYLRARYPEQILSESLCEIASVGRVGEAEELLRGEPGFDLMVVEPRHFISELFPRLREWRRQYQHMKLVVISSATERAHILTALDAGIHGFIPKNHSAEEICSAIGFILADYLYLPNEFAKINFGTETRGLTPQTPPQNADNAPVAPEQKLDKPQGFAQLSSKQREILLRLISGRNAAEIARELNLAEATIQVHISAVMRFLGARQELLNNQHTVQQNNNPPMPQTDILKHG